MLLTCCCHLLFLLLGVGVQVGEALEQSVGDRAVRVMSHFRYRLYVEGLHLKCHHVEAFAKSFELHSDIVLDKLLFENVGFVVSIDLMLR